MRVRRSSRLVVVDDDRRVLLFRCEDPTLVREGFVPAEDGRGFYWNTPGGGLEGEETFEEAARRELREETGIAEFDLGACVLEQTVRCPNAFHHERFYPVWVPAKAVVTDEVGETAADVYRGFRWWTLAELEASEEAFLPARLPGLVRSVLEVLADDDDRLRDSDEDSAVQQWGQRRPSGGRAG